MLAVEGTNLFVVLALLLAFVIALVGAWLAADVPHKLVAGALALVALGLAIQAFT